MTRRERLIHSFAGRPVDRPAVSFYEIDGYNQKPGDPDRCNIFSDPSWAPLLELARERSDRMVMLAALTVKDGRFPDLVPEEFVSTRVEEKPEGRVHHTAVRAGGRTLTGTVLVDPDVNTGWHIEHLIKSAEDLEAWIELPETPHDGEAHTEEILRCEEAIGDSGIVLVDTGDPLCVVAGMMPMEEYTVVAMTEPELFRRALEKAQRFLLWRVETVARALPGRAWRVCGPEYACPPYLSPDFFRDYVVEFDRPIFEAIRRSGGWPRMHCHGRIREVLDAIVDTGAVALDPVEPPPQGDVELDWVLRHYGRDLTIFGNLEAAEIENLSETAFRERVRRALADGMAGMQRGFVLMPSACPYGRKLTPAAMRNYEVMIEEVDRV